MSNVKSIMVTTLIMMGVAFSDNSLTLMNLVPPTGVDADTLSYSVDVYMVNEDPVGGYQFGLPGVDMTGGSGGSSAEAGFTVSASATTLLAFSFTGATIPAGEGVLITVSFENPNDSAEACIEGAVVSDATGGGLDFSTGCIALVEGGGCTDSYACNYDSEAQFDDGSCVYEEQCSDCDGNCTCFEDCSGVCDGTDTSCFTLDDGFVGAWYLEISFFEEDCITPTTETFLCDDGSDLTYANEDDCLAACSDSEACYDLAEELPSWVVFNADGTAQVGADTDQSCVEDSECVFEDYYGYIEESGYCINSFCTMVWDNYWGISPDGCFEVWDGDNPNSDAGDCSGYTFGEDGSFIVSGDYDAGLCEEIVGMSTEQGCMDSDATNFDDEAGVPCFDCCEYPAPEQEVNMQITNVTSDNVEVSVSLNAVMGGFQFTLASTCDTIAWTGGSGGLAEDAGFLISVGGSGIVLGFSMSGATISSGSEGVLINVGTDFDCDEATFSIAAGTFSSAEGTALSYDLGTSFDYPPETSCEDGLIEDECGVCGGDNSTCTDECGVVNGDNSTCTDCNNVVNGDAAVDDCGDCLLSYCYDMETHIPDYNTSQEDCAAAGNTWINPGDEGDPTWNAAMDCAGVCDGSSTEDCAGECGGTAEEDACGECGGDAQDASECMEHFIVDLPVTGVSQLVIFTNSITSLEAGDEVGVFDATAITNSGDCSSTFGGLLVGSGIWTGEQLEVVGIGSVDNCAFGGTQLPGWVDGNEVMIKVYRPSDGVEYAATATYSAGTGTFGDLFMAVSELALEEPNPPFYNVELNATGVNQLLILTGSITGLEAGDEIGVFDSAAITNSGDCSSTLGELLVGTGVWSDEQLEIVAIGSVDNCAFGGTQLPGWVDGNSVVLKVYRSSTDLEYAATATYSAGTGTFGDLFMAVSEINLGDVLANDDVWLGPDSYTLNQNYPNPFNPSTDISFDAGVSGEVSLVIYDILGNQVKTLASGFVTPGHYVVSWNGTDNSGNNVSSGVYVYTLITSDQTISKRMLLVK